MPYGHLCCFMLPSASVGCYLYHRCSIVLRNQRTNDARNRSLTFCFAVLCVLWVVCTLPFFTLTIVFQHLMMSPEIQRKFSPLEGFNAQISLSYIVAATEALRHSYSLVNSIVLIALVKPFQQPVLRLLNYADRIKFPELKHALKI